jgi:hypothetical protein
MFEVFNRKSIYPLSRVHPLFLSVFVETIIILTWTWWDYYLNQAFVLGKNREVLSVLVYLGG